MALSFEQWQKQKKELEAARAKSGELSFEQWKKAKELNVIDQPTPTPEEETPTKSFFSPQDPGIIKSAVKDFVYGIVPGSREAVKEASEGKAEKPRTFGPLILPSNRVLKAAAQDTGEMAKGILGIPFRLGATAKDAYTTGKAALKGEQVDPSELTSFNIPGLGEQQSMQKGIAQNLETGASPAVAGTLGGAQTLFDFLLGKGVIKGAKGKIVKSTELNAAKPTAQGMLSMKEPAAPVKTPLQLPARTETRPPIVPEAPKPANFTDMTSIVRDTPEAYKIEKPSKVTTETSSVPKDYGEKMRAFIKGEKSYEDLVRETEQKSTPKSTTVEPPNTEKALVELDSLMESPTETRWQGAKKWMTRNNPLGFEGDKIATYGKAGQELRTRVRRSWARSVELKERYRQINKESGITEFTPDELTNLRDVIEKGVAPANERVANAAPIYKSMFDEGAELLQIAPEDRLSGYFHRSITDEGKLSLGKVTETSEIAKAVAKEKGISLTEAVDILRGGVKKAGAERSRILPDEIAAKIRKDPLTEILEWQEGTARRAGIIQELGKEGISTGGQQIPTGALKLIDEMVAQAKNPGEDIHIRKIAGNYIDKVLGRSGNYTDAKGALRFLKSSMVTSKLNPATSVANSFQGLVSSWGDYGVKGLLDTMNKNNDTFIKKLGFDNLKQDIVGEVTGQQSRMDKFTKAYMKGIGMEKTEAINFMQTARSTTAANIRAFEALKKNPNDKIARKVLEREGMFVEPGSLEQALKKGVIPDSELAMGVIEGVRRKMHPVAPGERPAWAATPVGSTAYIFHNYLLSQLKLVSSWPKHRQVLYYGIIAPVLGIPPLVLRRAIQGKELPQSPEEWFVEAAQSGPGTPFDIYKTVSNPEFLTNYAFGGFSPAVELVTGENKPKALVRGFLPGGSVISNWMFPNKKK